jgi:hypothetical protein
MHTPSDPFTDDLIIGLWPRSKGGSPSGVNGVQFSDSSSKDDKDKIAAWKQDLVRVLQVFNVRSVGFAGNS